jgi:tripartite-type tricarboxylate transporter receptor subunit TctC
MLEQQAGIQMTHVPYKGTGPALQDLLGGQVDLTFGTPPPFMPHIASGKLRAIATTGATRLPSLPDVPTTTEAGMPKLTPTSWFAVFAPAATPKPILERLSTEVRKVINGPGVKDIWEKQGAMPMAMTPEEFGKFLRDDIAKWAKLVKDTGMKVD